MSIISIIFSALFWFLTCTDKVTYFVNMEANEKPNGLLDFHTLSYIFIYSGQHVLQILKSSNLIYKCNL